jgi:hypothetical protein
MTEALPSQHCWVHAPVRGHKAIMPPSGFQHAYRCSILQQSSCHYNIFVSSTALSVFTMCFYVLMLTAKPVLNGTSL